jgi:hypothetical protein
MASPFPGMDPYLEQARFWPEFHSRLIVAIADALAPSLLPRYYIAVETRTYRDSGDEELLVGIADAVVLSTPGASAPAQPETPGPGVATTVRPQSVILPMPLEVKERYLEIRETGSSDRLSSPPAPSCPGGGGPSLAGGAIAQSLIQA